MWEESGRYDRCFSCKRRGRVAWHNTIDGRSCCRSCWRAIFPALARLERGEISPTILSPLWTLYP